MEKKHTNLLIEEGIIESMKENKLNMSEIAENAFKEKLGFVTLQPNQARCYECGIKSDMFASGKKPNEGLMWLWPHLKWICQKCFREESLKIRKHLIPT